MRGGRGRHHDGGVLLEVLISLALFVGAASFTLGAISNVLGALDRSRRQAVAVDLARTRMAELEAGLVTIAELREGAPIESVGTIQSYAGDEQFASKGSEELWIIEIDTEPTEFTGLTLVELTVSEDRDDLFGDEAPVISFTLRQLLALGERAEEEYELDELMRDLPPEAGTRP